MINILEGDCLEVLARLPDCCVDSVVTDPPYGLGFMGKDWDAGTPAVEIFEQCLRVLKPGGHLLAFGGSRTYHRLAVAVEDAGFDIRDQILWVYGSGFPKSLDVGKAIDKLDATEKRRKRQLSFTKWMRGAGLSAGDINRITGTDMGGHYLTSASQPAVPTRELFEALRPYVKGRVPGWVEQMIDERTVESENFKQREVVKQNRGSLLAVAPGQNNDRRRAVLNITAPATDKAREWEGWGTALKPAHEPIVMARKPLDGTVAANVIKWGVGALNIGACRIPSERKTGWGGGAAGGNTGDDNNCGLAKKGEARPVEGRWPANFTHDGSDEVLAGFPDAKGQPRNDNSTSAARFFYCAKASKKDREEGLSEFNDVVLARSDQAQADAVRGRTVESAPGAYNKARIVKNNHPTVKPVELMSYLCRLVTPPGGTILDPFMGSGSTGKAARREGFGFIGIEHDPEYVKIARARVGS